MKHDICDIWALGFGELVHDLTHSRLKSYFRCSPWSLDCRLLSGNIIVEKFQMLTGIFLLGGVKSSKESPTHDYHCSSLALPGAKVSSRPGQV